MHSFKAILVQGMELITNKDTEEYRIATSQLLLLPLVIAPTAVSDTVAYFLTMLIYNLDGMK